MSIKFKIFFLLLVIHFFSNSSIAQNGVVNKGALTWSDEFEGIGAPDPAKWDRPEYNRRNNNNGPDGWWSRDDSYLDGNGNLVIRVRKIDNKNNDGDSHDYSVGAIRTKGKFEQLYGVFEIRCKLPTQKGWWVAFWMMQGNMDSEINGGIDGSEVDIMEGFGWTDKINQAVHYDGYGSALRSVSNKEEIEGIRDEFHTYTLEWHPDKYIFFIDGVETWRTIGGGVCNRPGYIKVTGELSTEDWAITQHWSENPAYAQYPDSFLVDYVRVYTIPEEEEKLPIRDMVEKCYPEGNLVVGAACHEHYLGTQTEEILDTEFGYVTPANDFKQSYVHPSPGVWKWEKSDIWVKHCRENNQLIRLHAPISPQCSQWAKDDSRTGPELEQNLTEYMTELCKRYNDSTHIKWLDVVNETVNTDGTWFGPKPGTDKWENPWTIIGFDNSHELNPPIYIKKAFEIANEHAPNIKLIINQHGGMELVAWDKIKKLVVYLRENNLRIDGIGWQAHLWMGWEKEAGNMEKLSDLIDWCHENELEFHITEFNVWLKEADLDKRSEQANTFYEITKLAAEKQDSGFVGINYWHIRGVETANKDRDGCPWAENYEPKEAYFKIKEALCEASEFCEGDCGADGFILDIDTFGTGSTKNMIDGDWLGFSDANSSNNIDFETPDGFQESECAKFEWTLQKGAVDYPYSILQTYLNSSKTGVNLIDYHALKFQARGNGSIKVGIITSQSEVEGNHYFKNIQLKENWTNYEIPFSEFVQNWGVQVPIDTGSVVALQFSGSGNFDSPGVLWLDNIQIISEDELSPIEPPEPQTPFVSFNPKANQLGYLPNAFKEFSIISDSLSAGEEFEILNEDEEVAFSGTLSNKEFDDSEISGEKVYKGDFSEFKSTGKYRIKVGDKESFLFEINEMVYDSLLTDALRFFYLVRANETIDDPQTGLSHPGGHFDDETLNDGEGNLLDLSGGWYNAGDFGKWTHTTAFSCAHLLNLYEINPNYFKLQSLNIPESNNELPDILDQAKIGLNWLLKMQRNDGAVFHKVDSEPNFAYGYGPDEDPHSRKLGDPENMSTIDAADFTAVIAHASRIFAPYDSAFSATCKAAALKSWEWVQANPGIGQQDIYYTDPQSWQEEMWAKAEIFMLTGDNGVLSSFYSDLTSKLVSKPVWTQPQMLSFANLYHTENVPGIVKSWIKIKMENYANELKDIVDKSAYGSAIDKFGWGWGSNTFMSNFGASFIYAHQITGDDKWLKYASQQFDYLLGRNSLDYSFVSGYGSNFCKQPFHWITKTYGMVPRGFIGQGATGAHLKDLVNVDGIVKELMIAEFPSAKIYRDSVDSWNSNEIGIYTMSSMAFLSGYLALHDREVEITDGPFFQNGQSGELKITDRDYHLFCENCIGKTEIRLYSVNGQLLKSETINSAKSKTELCNFEALINNYPIILFQISDETGNYKTGKLSFYTGDGQ